ncbi:MAG TPA: nickel-dependent lactate racemase [Bacillota bacterium]|nr:nickel-dependent lactate racemase [Bacillota bacterium]HPM63490.1 nickel-dependent lactate racemase [Bacillota bacterium]
MENILKTRENFEVAIPFGDEEASFRLSGVRFVGRYGLAAALETGDTEGIILKALYSPTGSSTLSEIARGSRRVAVISDDATRPTPVSLIIPHVLAELEAAGVPKEGITIVMANGSHRKMSKEEIDAKLGPDVAASYRIDNHDYKAADLVDLGSTPSGVPVMMNKTVADADFAVGIGSIVPHRYCGWSGGAKIIQPGVCGEKTTVATHLMITKDPGVRVGNVENVVRHEMEEVARKAHLGFIVNVVLDSEGKTAGAVAGDPVKAHRKGVEMATGIVAARIPQKADLVICSSHPANMNFWQAGKAFYTADIAVEDGGTILLATPAYEGIGEHPEFGKLLALEYDEIIRMLDAKEVEDQLGAAAALAMRLVARRARVAIVTDGLSRSEVEAMGFAYYPAGRLQEAVDAEIGLLRAKGKDPSVTVMAEAPDMFPVIG